MSSTDWAIRFVQDDKNRTPVLIHLSRKEGGHELDLDLLATDGEAAFTAKGKQRSMKKLRAKSYDGTDEDWSSLVSAVLDPSSESLVSKQQRDSLEVICSIAGKEPKRTLLITLNNKIEEITQRLGALELSETQDTDEVDLFGWASQALEQTASLRGEITNLKEKDKSQDNIVSSLQKQLDELVEAKAEHEKQMLSKFTMLLNEKKLKIRNLQRIVSTAKTDEKKLRELQAEIGSELGGLARRNKRPADDEAQDVDDESDDFETMEVNPTPDVEKEPDSPASNNTTPTASEDDNDDEPDDDNTEGQGSSSNQPKSSEVPSHQKPKERATQSKEQTRTANAPAPSTGDDEETESEESEL